MRYTTIIDIRDFPEVYSNKNAVLLYLHLCLRAGYHAEDRDLVRIPVRRLSAEVGITYSAVRHSLAVLSKHRLLEIMPNSVLKVCKFVVPTEIPSRSSAKKTIEQERFEEQMRLDREEQKKRQDERKKREEEGLGPKSFLIYLEQKAAGGDQKAKKEAADLRLQLQKQGVI